MSSLKPSIKEIVMDDLVPSFMSSVIALAGFKFALGGNLFGEASLFGFETNNVVLIGSTQFASSLTGSVLQYQVAPFLDKYSSYFDVATGLLKPVLAGGALYGIMSLAVRGEGGVVEFMPTFGLGAISDITGSYVSKNVISKL